MQHSKIDKTRMQWIDALKGFGIFCVTFGHLNPWMPLETHIYSFHMCLFFFISGYLFTLRTPLLTYVKKKIKNILIPFIAWDLMASMVSIILGDNLKEVLLKLFVINGDLCWNAPIWFLLILFIAEILYALFMYFSNSKKTILIIIVVSIVLWILCGNYSFHFKLNILPLAICFYACGNLFRLSYKNSSLKLTIILLSFLGVISIIMGNYFNVRISYTDGNFGNIYFCIVAAFAGTLFYVLLFQKCKFFKTNKMLCAIGKNSLIIMSTQYCFFRVYDLISQKLFGISIWNYRSTIKALIVSIITIYFIMLSIVIFKKIFKNNNIILKLSYYIGIR